MSLVICSRPECQTTAGCKCKTVWSNPAPYAAALLGNIHVFHGQVGTMTDRERELEKQMREAIRIWLECPAHKRPSAAALGERITSLASQQIRQP